MLDLKVNNVEIKCPNEFKVTVLDVDDGETSVRTADGTLNRDRVAVKRQIEMSWTMIKWSELSTILQAMADVFFDFYYPDPMTGQYETKTFYVGNRPAPMALVKDGEIYWTDVKIILTER